MSVDEILSGNYTDCHSETVYRKAKSEWIVHDVLHSDPFTELVLCNEMLMNEGDTSGGLKVTFKTLLLSFFW